MVQLGQRVIGRNPELADAQRTWEEPDEVTWRKLVLRAPKVDGSWADVEMLQSVAWIEEQNAKVGGTVEISVPECGIEGNAEVLRIEPCPPIEPGDGPIVTATFHHQAASTVVDSLLHDFAWGSIVESFSRPMIKFGLDFLELVCCDFTEAGKY